MLLVVLPLLLLLSVYYRVRAISSLSTFVSIEFVGLDVLFTPNFFVVAAMIDTSYNIIEEVRVEKEGEGRSSGRP